MSGYAAGTRLLSATSELRLDANWVDYLLVAIYFVFVIGIGLMARRSVSSSLDFFLSGRSLPAWVTGLAFISANLGAIEIMGMSANGAQFGIPTMHYYWIGAVPAMLFLGVVMMPFYYGSKVRSVPEFMRKRFGSGAHLVNALSFAVAQLLIAGHQPVPARQDRQHPARLEPLPLPRRRGPGGAVLHHRRWSLGGHLQRGAAVLRDRGGTAPADDRRSAQGRRVQRPGGQDHQGR